MICTFVDDIVPVGVLHYCLAGEIMLLDCHYMIDCVLAF